MSTSSKVMVLSPFCGRAKSLQRKANKRPLQVLFNKYIFPPTGPFDIAYHQNICGDLARVYAP